jgi:hypothetical protein
MVIAEVAVVGALIAVAWHAFAGATSSSAAAPLLFPAVGLSLGIEFWRLRLSSLNRDEAAFEALEWRITHAVMNAAHEYIETVVLPAVRRAEGGVA